ncbi:MAG: hypothetical protein ACI9R3_004281 [Verrucomicrobiales bacterium]|jgi:hypothetical protein
MSRAAVSEVAFDRSQLTEENRVRRELLVLFGNDLREVSTDLGWPRDTVAARKLQTPLEWMGYELHYHNLLKEGELKDGDLERYGGLIVDGSLHVSEGIEEYAAGAVAAARKSGIPVLFAGPYPFSSQIAMAKVASTLGLKGDGSLLAAPQTSGILSLDREMMNFEADVRPMTVPTIDLQAPTGAEIYLSIMARSAAGNSVKFDPVFVADWGGMALEPYLDFQPSSKQALLLVDLYKFLARIWPIGAFPAPDPTTRNGMRVFLSHIDGDGFATLSHLKGGATCGELIFERILKRYPFPVTVSVVEANLRGLELGLRPESSPELEQTAREIFALPYVEAATHTYTHPFVWLDSDLPYEEQYESRNLLLNPGVDYPAIDLEREIGGSAAYVQTLLPKGKRVELVLWSGNCQPGVEALRVASDYGLGNMNGGDTVISKRYPGIAGVAPRVMYWDEKIQVLAPNQNDFVYTQDWRGRSRTGFSEVIETFEMTESPRRLKPVNVYYHFYSGALLGPLSALNKVYQWCGNQPLHPVRASEFTKMTLDSHRTKIYRTSERRWHLVNQGDLRTFRMPVTAGVPRIASSSGITGYVRSGDWHYIHTDGRSEVVLEMGNGENAGQSLFLEKSPLELDLENLSEDSAQFRFTGSSMVSSDTVFGGGDPGGEYVLKVGKSQVVLAADASGKLRLKLRGNGKASLTGKR